MLAMTTRLVGEPSCELSKVLIAVCEPALGQSLRLHGLEMIFWKSLNRSIVPPPKAV